MTYARRFLSDTSLTTIRPPSPPAAKEVAVAEPPEAEAAESDFVVILAALMCALICVVGLIAVARCAWLRRGVGGSWWFGGHLSANKGLKKKVLRSLPKYTYDSSSAAEKGKAAAAATAAECPICLTEYADGDEIRVLPQCGHGFHVQCIDTWLCSHSSCPSCRQILARCRKCGEFPATSGGSGGGGQTEVKPRQDSSAASTSSSTVLP